MLIDSNGRPITADVKKQIMQNAQEEVKVKNLNVAVSAGGVEDSRNLDSDLKSHLISKISQRNSRNKKTPLVQKHGKYKDLPEYGKEYPGAHPLVALRAMAWSSTVVYSILTYRRHQLTKREILLRPKNDEPSFRFNILQYSPAEIMRHAALDEIDKYAVLDLFRKIDPFNDHQRKLKKYEETKDSLSKSDINLIEYYNKKHLEFHRARNQDKQQILELLRNPDPYYSEESSWYYLLSNVLEDMLLIDRGALIKVRNSEGKIIALTPVDGITIRPYIDENGFITHYVQVVDGEPTREYIDRNDVILMRMNVSPDIYMYGYGVPNMDILWNTVLSDLYIDKGNIDYYRKGGSVPEGFLSVEPPGGDDDMYVQYDKEQLDGIQRQLQSIIMSDFTQVPLISGGKFNWIDLKGKRRDMQFKELAEYLTRKICAVFQVSPQDVGVLQDVNRSTAETQASLTKSKGLDTIAFNVSHNITRGVIDEFRKEKDLRLWFEEDDPDSIKEWWATVQGQLQAGYKSINEVRSDQGEDPVPWGDAPMQGLKNWSPIEAFAEEQQQGMPGMPGMPGMSPGGGGGAPLPPGLDQVAAAGGGPSPVPIPGQIPGAAPALGQAPAIKSVLTELLEPGFSETYANLDVEPIIKNLFSTTRPIAEIYDELTEYQEAEVIEQDLTSGATLFLKDSIKQFGISTKHSKYENVDPSITLHIQIPESMYKKENFLKIAMYLMKFSGDSRIVDISPDRAIVKLFDVGVLATTENTEDLVSSVINVLNEMSFSGQIELEFSHEKFDSYVIPVEQGDTFKKVIQKITNPTSLVDLVHRVRINEDIADAALSKLEKMTKSADKKGSAPTFQQAENILCLGIDDRTSKRALDILKATSFAAGEFYENLYRMYKKYFEKKTTQQLIRSENIKFDVDMYDKMQDIVNNYANSSNIKDIYAEIMARYSFATNLDVTNEDEVILEPILQAYAYNKKLESILSFDETKERILALFELPKEAVSIMASYELEAELNMSITNMHRMISSALTNKLDYYKLEYGNEFVDYDICEDDYSEFEVITKAANASAAKRVSNGVEYRGTVFPGFNKPKKSNRDGKKKMVLAKKGDKIKVVHYGDTNYKHNYSKEAKENFRSRHNCSEQKDKFSAAYWACKDLWPTGKINKSILSDDMAYQDLVEQVQELSNQFYNFYSSYLVENLFVKIETRLERLITSALRQTLMLAFIAIQDYESLQQTVEDILAENYLTIELEPEYFTDIQTLDQVVDATVPVIIETYDIEDEYMLKSIVSKLLKDESLTNFESKMLKLIGS